MDKLSDLELEVAGERIQLDAGKQYVVSRSNEKNDKRIISIQSSMVSGRHCLLKAFTDSVTITDLISNVGTFLNGKALTSLEEAKVVAGDKLEFGKDSGVVMCVMRKQVANSTIEHLRRNKNLTADHSFVAETPDASMLCFQEDVDFGNISVPETQDFPLGMEPKLLNDQFLSMDIDLPSLNESGDPTVRETDKDNFRNIPIQQLQEQHSPQPYDAIFDDDDLMAPTQLTDSQLKQNSFEKVENTKDSEADGADEKHDSSNSQEKSKICISGVEKEPQSSLFRETDEPSKIDNTSANAIIEADKGNISAPYTTTELQNQTFNTSDFRSSTQLTDSCNLPVSQQQQCDNPQPYGPTSDADDLTDHTTQHTNTQISQDILQGMEQKQDSESFGHEILQLSNTLTPSSIELRNETIALLTAHYVLLSDKAGPSTSRTCGIVKIEKEGEPKSPSFTVVDDLPDKQTTVGESKSTTILIAQDKSQEESSVSNARASSKKISRLKVAAEKNKKYPEQSSSMPSTSRDVKSRCKESSNPNQITPPVRTSSKEPKIALKRSATSLHDERTHKLPHIVAIQASSYSEVPTTSIILQPKRPARLASSSSIPPKITAESNEERTQPLSRKAQSKEPYASHRACTLTKKTAKTTTGKEKLNAKRVQSEFYGKSHIKIITTTVDPERLEAFMKKSHGLLSIAEDPIDAELLVMDEGVRTFKFLVAVAKGLPIVTSEWLHAVTLEKSLVDCTTYFFKNVKFEKKYSFKLAEIREAHEQKLFEKHHFICTDNIEPSPNEMRTIIQCCGGEVSSEVPRSLPKDHKLYLISSDEDRKKFNKFRRASAGIKVIGTEGVMTAVMRQNNKHLDEHMLYP